PRHRAAAVVLVPYPTRFRSAAVHQQAASIHYCRAGVGVVGGGEDRGPGADLLERTRAGNDAAEGERVRTVDREGAVVYHIAHDRAARAAVAELQRASADGRATGIGVGGSEDGGARADLCEG